MTASPNSQTFLEYKRTADLFELVKTIGDKAAVEKTAFRRVAWNLCPQNLKKLITNGTIEEVDEDHINFICACKYVRRRMFRVTGKKVDILGTGMDELGDGLTRVHFVVRDCDAERLIGRAYSMDGHWGSRE